MNSRPYTPHDYQSAAVEFVATNPRAALFLDMGLGKTSIVLSAVVPLIVSGEIRRVLVIAPKRVADRTWSAEAAKWSHTAGIRFSRVLGTAAQREAALNVPAHVFTINRENVKWLVDYFLARKVWPFDMVVIDESDSFKDPGSIRFRALRKVTKKAARVVLLSGTPTPNNYLDLWAQFYLLDPGILGPSITGFRETLFDPDKRNRTRVFTHKLKPGSRELIEAMIRPVTLSLRAADYLTLPPRVDNVVTVALSKKARAAYDTLERDLVLRITGDGVVTAANAAVLAGKLAQAANGAIYDEARDVHHVHDDKLDALAEILDTATGPALIAVAYQHDAARILEAIPGSVDLTLPGMLDAWDRGEIRAGVAHPASLGHGLNMQDGGSCVIWFGLSWSSAYTAQFNARLYRQGQTRPVFVTYLVSEGTVDEDIVQTVDAKTNAQEILLNALKRRAAKCTA